MTGQAPAPAYASSERPAADHPGGLDEGGGKILGARGCRAAGRAALPIYHEVLPERRLGDNRVQASVHVAKAPGPEQRARWLACGRGNALESCPHPSRAGLV